jgi:hypothetical protein
METNYFGSMRWRALRSDPPRKQAARSSTCCLSLIHLLPQGATYSASKAAAVAHERACIEPDAGHLVSQAVHAGFIDTDMAAGVTGTRSAPIRRATDRRRPRHRRRRVLADPTSEMVKATLPTTTALTRRSRQGTRKWWDSHNPGPNADRHTTSAERRHPSSADGSTSPANRPGDRHPGDLGSGCARVPCGLTNSRRYS